MASSSSVSSGLGSPPSQPISSSNYGISNQWFEIRTAGPKGVGLFASNLIPAGTRIFSEKPIAVLPKEITPEAVVQTYNELSREQQQRYDRLRCRFDIHGGGNAAQGRPTGCALVVEQCNMNLHTITDKLETRYGVYQIPSLMNHSCHPNIHYTHTELDDGAEQTAYAFLDIANGEKLAYLYSAAALYMSIEERR